MAVPTDTADVNDVVVRVLDESSVEHEDAVNELWRNTRAKFLPRRYIRLGNQQFVTVPPTLPTSYTTPPLSVRLHYIKMAVPMVLESDTVDPSIPDYYQDAIRYAAMAYLIEKDTDLKSLQLKGEMMKSLDFHMSGGVAKLAQGETDA